MVEKTLSSLEGEVMGIVWTLKKCSIKEAKAVLDKKRKLAYTTVATIFKRLKDKGVLTINTCTCPKCTCEVCYCPKVSKADYSKDLTFAFANNLLATFGDTALDSFAQVIKTLPKHKHKIDK